MREEFRGKIHTSPRPSYRSCVRQLSKSDQLRVNLIFNRARGYSKGLALDRFRDTLLLEAAVAIPDYLVQRFYREWNASRDGEISLLEFIAGIAIALTGSRDDHLEMVFRMVTASGDGRIASRSDVLQFFGYFAVNRCVAIEKGKSARSWTTEECVRVLLNSTQNGAITREKFLSTFGSRGSFRVLHFVDWIPSLARRVMQDTTLRTFPHRSPVRFPTEEYSLSSRQKHDFRRELHHILMELSTDPPALAPDRVLDRFRKALDDDFLVDIIANIWELVNVTDTRQSIVKLFVLTLCVTLASDVDRFYRLLFELFDEFSCGQVNLEQLRIFLQLTTGRSSIDCEREANITIRRRGKAHSLTPPPTSPSRMPMVNSNSPHILTLAQFIEVAQEQPGFSVAEVETAQILFRINRCIGNNTLPFDPIVDYTSHKAQSNAFCLLKPREWQLLIKETLRSQQERSPCLRAEILYQEATELPSGNLMIPLSTWLMITNIPSTTLKQTLFKGFWVRLSVSLTSRDGFERKANFPQAIVLEPCTLQNVLEAALFKQNWLGEDAQYEVSLCQVHLAERNAAGEIKPLKLLDNLPLVQQDQLAVPMGLVCPSICPSWAMENVVAQDKVAFELRFSVIELENLEDKGRNVEVSKADVDEREGQQPVHQPLQLNTIRTPRGLANLGNTCFMNAVFQCLAATPMLDLLFSRNEHCATDKPIAARKKTFPEVVGEIFAEMSRDNRDAATNVTISPMIFLKALSELAPDMTDGNQQDAQEFLVCLLNHLSTTFKREPKESEDSMILSPRSHVWLANLFQRKDNGTHGTSSLPFCAEDSNGRHDRLVATEWWVSHLVNEPSLVNILFSGQFKSVLTCNPCTHHSARFEPFSSLQLPLEELVADLPTASQQDVVVIVHLTKSKNEIGTSDPVRVVVEVDEHATVENVLTQLPFPQTQYVLGSPNGFTIRNLLLNDVVSGQVDEKTPVSALPKPLHVFELVHITSTGDDTVSPTTGSTKVYLRFVHRRSFLVPFYCSTPTRQTLCGSPFVCSSTMGALTGQSLYQMVLHQFLLGHRAQSRFSSNADMTQHPYAPSFVLCRVREDGIACSCCHWSSGCRGCHILPTATAAELLDLDTCETIAIDWDLQLHPQDHSAFWWLQSHPTRDHSSHVRYRLTKTHSLQQSLRSLCSTESLDASCSHCQQESSPHTKQLSLWSLPPVLVLQLKRFTLSTANGNYQWRKLSHNVDFPLQNFDLRDFLSPIGGGHDDSHLCTDNCFADHLDPRVHRGIDFLQNELHIPLSSASRTCTKYDLYAVVHHSGPGIGSGHYTAQFRRFNEKCWWNADDAIITPINQDDISPSSTAYLLFYARQDIASGVTELSDLFPPHPV